MLWVAIALVVTAVLLLIGVAISVYRRTRAQQSESFPQSLATGAVPEAERLLRLMGEAEELAARLTAQLDDKARHLEHLLRQADARTASLTERQAYRPVPSPGAFQQTHPPAAPQSPPPQATPASDPRVITRPINLATTIHAPSPVASFSGSGLQPSAQHSIGQHSPAPAPAPPVPPPSAVDGASDPIVTTICRLADQGVAATAIAQQLNQPIGKVELILALRQA